MFVAFFFVKDKAFCGVQLTVMQDVSLCHHGDSECRIGGVEEELFIGTTLHVIP